ncbi:MAG TPA: arginase family protein [Solirubrobacteraceae bacterium]
MARPLSVIVLRCRTSDRTAGGARGAEALARALDADARIIGSPGEPRIGGYADDLRDSRGCLLEAGGQVDDALAAGRRPLLLAADCSICLTTLAAVMRHAPDAHVLWLDAHGDFNTPETTPSAFLGGMCLAAACGRWDAGLDAPPIDPARVVMCGVRDLDGGERVELERAGVRIERPSRIADALRAQRVYVHLDLDVLDPGVLPARFEAPHGMSDTGLRTLLREVARACDVLGAEVTALDVPEEGAERERRAELAAGVVRALIA